MEGKLPAFGANLRIQERIVALMHWKYAIATNHQPVGRSTMLK